VSGLRERFGEGFNEGADLISHAPVMRHCHFIARRGLGEARRIVEADMDDLRAGDDGAGFVRGVADGYDDIKLHASRGEILRRFGCMPGDIDPHLGHRANGERIQAVRVGSGGVRIEHIAFEGAGEPLGHLAAAGVAGAEEEDAGLGA